MTNTTTKQHYEQMLGLTAPWVVLSINLDVENFYCGILGNKIF